MQLFPIHIIIFFFFLDDDINDFEGEGWIGAPFGTSGGNQIGKNIAPPQPTVQLFEIFKNKFKWLLCLIAFF